MGSRRSADALIAAGRVTVNGRRCSDFHYRPLDTDYVKVDGKLVRANAHVYLALNKPAGLVCTKRDVRAPDTIYDLLPPKFASLFYVGRLDVASDGLLLMTNDGELGQRLAHPRFKIAKEYEVTLTKPAGSGLRAQLLAGVRLNGRLATAAQVQQISPTRFRLVLEQGINRQIRKMVEHFGFRVKRLKRIRVGNVKLGNLRMGRWRYLQPEEVRLLRAKATFSRPGELWK